MPNEAPSQRFRPREHLRSPADFRRVYERRRWLEDGDTVVLRAWAEKPGHARIGFGECRGTVLPAREFKGG